jgi:hypothetical protein
LDRASLLRKAVLQRTGGSSRSAATAAFVAEANNAVTIKEPTTTLCMITLKSAKGACTPSAEKLPVGTYHVVATYNGSADFGGSTSATETLTVAEQ